MEYELMRVREFISENWAAWQSQCDHNGDDADELYEALGSEE